MEIMNSLICVILTGWHRSLCQEHKEARLEAWNDHDLAYRLYKGKLDIKNYGWVTLTAKEEKNVESEEGKIIFILTW